MGIGEVPADWRNRRIAVRARLIRSKTLPAIRFLDIEALKSRRVLERELAPLLAYYGYSELDVPTVRGGDRRVTRWIGKWAFDLRDERGAPVFAGIRYLSRLNTEWECWAVFHDVGIKEVSRQPVERGNPSLTAVAREFGLTVF